MSQKDEIKMGLLYGIEGLKVCTESKEKDSWLDLFRVVFEDIDSYELYDDSTLASELEELAGVAEEVKNASLEERQNIIEEHNMISRSEKIYDKL